MDVEKVVLSSNSISRIRNHIKLLINVYFKVAKRHLNQENEADLEDFAKLLMAFSAAIGAHIRSQGGKVELIGGATEQEINFCKNSYDILKR